MDGLDYGQGSRTFFQKGFVSKKEKGFSKVEVVFSHGPLRSNRRVLYLARLDTMTPISILTRSLTSICLQNLFLGSALLVLHIVFLRVGSLVKMILSCSRIKDSNLYVTSKPVIAAMQKHMHMFVHVL